MKTFRSFVACAALCAVGVASAQQAPAEEPGWAKGRPKTDTAMKMAPVPAFPVPTPADQLPTKKFKLPPGFKVETWASGVLDAREIREGPKGTIVVSTLFVGNKVYAFPPGKREPKVIIDKLPMAAGIAFDSKGNLYVGDEHEVLPLRQHRGQARQPGRAQGDLRQAARRRRPQLEVLPHQGRQALLPIGAPCNICDPGEYAKIYRMNLDGTGVETIASGVRNTVGFDFDPKTGYIWFTDNGRDWFSEELPNDELNGRHKQPGKQHFGFPYCHQGNLPDPEFGWGKSCDDYVKPAALLGPHAGSLGLKFYTGKMFPAKYQGAMFIAKHGPWNRTKKYNGVYVAWPDGKGGAKVEEFMTGFVENNAYLGRPVDFHVMKDGSLLVSDDHAGAIYRISYGGK